MICWYSIQQPNWMTEKSKRKLHGFHRRPASMTMTNTTAVSVRVFNIARFNAICLFVLACDGKRRPFAHVDEYADDQHHACQHQVPGDDGSFINHPGVLAHHNDLYPVEKGMGEYGGPETAAVPIRRAQQDAEEHPRQETLELQVKGRKKNTGDDDAGPMVLKKVYHDALQRAPETDLFEHGRNDSHHQQIDVQIGGILHLKEIFHLFVAVLLHLYHPLRHSDLLVQHAQPAFERIREKEQQDRRQITTRCRSRPETEVIEWTVAECQAGVKKGG